MLRESVSQKVFNKDAVLSVILQPAKNLFSILYFYLSLSYYSLSIISSIGFGFENRYP
jgi:hypothetical protein